MRAVVQRVTQARVLVGEDVVGSVGPGLCILLGVADGDTAEDARDLAGKIGRLRIFANDEGRFDRSVVDVGGSALVVSQFTLIADLAGGNRPSFSHAAKPEQARVLYEAFAADLEELGVHVETGRFGATMAVEITNDGPVTIVVGAEM